MSTFSPAKALEGLLFASRSRTVFLVAIHDAVMVAAALLASALLADAAVASQGFAATLAGALAAALPTLYLTGAHRQVWRYVDLRDVGALAATAAVTTGAALLGAMVSGEGSKPLYSAALIFLPLLLTLWIGPRLTVRALRDRLAAPAPAAGLEPVLVSGAGERARAFLQANAANRKFHVVGLVSDDPRLHHRRIGGAEVLGALDDLGRIIAHQHLRGARPIRLVIAEDGLSRAELQRRLEAAAAHSLLLSRSPDAADVTESGPAGVRPVAVDDLLNRPAVVLDRAAMRELIEGKVVLITGAGGSIGSELVRQAAQMSPSLLVLVESNEFNLYRIDQECSRAFPNLRRLAALADVRDRAALARWFERTRPDLVVHAAALKHVPLLEEHPEEAALTNVVGARHVAELAREHDAEAVVLVSTDKAVNPVSVMGATKRCAEVVFQAYDALRRSGQGRTRCLSVRFGNVLGSAGSVLPLFTQQIALGEAVTVTHPEMTRFFMTVTESAQLILQATATALRSEQASGVYVLDMGEPVRVLDLAERVIQLSGRRPHVDVPIRFVGLRAGEKLHEELAYDEEGLSASEHPGVLIARPRALPLPAALAAVDRLADAARAADRPALARALLELAPEFEPSGAALRAALRDVVPPPAARIRVIR